MSARRRGQMRIIEALLACILMFTCLSTSVFFANVYKVSKTTELKEAGLNIINTLDDPEVVKKIILKQEGWDSQLASLIENLLPPDTFYNLTIYSSSTGEELANLSNVVDQGDQTASDVESFQQVVTVSLPIARNQTRKLDVMLVIDRSGSMDQKEPGDEYNKIYYAKEAAKTFVDQLNMSKDTAGLVSFSTEATLDVHLTNSSSDVKAAIDDLYPNGWTNIGDAVNLTIQEFQLNGRSDSIWVMILLSDGKANRPYNETYAREYALSQAEAARNLGIRSYTIGLGAN
ncbi:VWA domain-containing protein, partial [Candidatus Bathyarchaeota archaeon]|nr:VWA domain-containing protein [Candidatus Bathyarchaeota archaeon]